MFVVDTNILVYAANDASPWNKSCRPLIESWHRRTGAWFLTWGICFEFLRVATHGRVLPRPLGLDQAWAFLSALLASPGLRILVPTDRFATVASEVFAELPSLAGNALHDAETAILMREHGVKTIYTRNLGFHRFKFIDVIDPAG
ncbi:MAG: TA system VapC family ribonuclease toxin [Rhodospirillaceae bacterium]|nr:TA system VapC family ribonuclease toxin [Rhodospirillaceae bacterium]